MADNTSIEWADASWSPIRACAKESMVVRGREVPAGKWGYHCERISPGCKNCYASTMNGRMLPAWGTGLDFTVPNREKVEIFLDETELLKPLKWKKPRRIFVESMSDWCATFVPDEMRDWILAVAALCPQHTFLFLTKRAKECAEYVATIPMGGHDGASAARVYYVAQVIAEMGRSGGTPAATIKAMLQWPLANVHLGFSAENQEYFDERWSHMRRLAAAGWKVWVSAEPLLSAIDMREALWPKVCEHCGHSGPCEHRGVLQQVVVGGESGHGARPMHAHWVESLWRQTGAAGVPFFFKQWGEFQDGSDPEWKKTYTVLNNGRFKATGEQWDRETENRWPDFAPRVMAKVGKKAAGRLLDGREWNEIPEEHHGTAR